MRKTWKRWWLRLLKRRTIRAGLAAAVVVGLLLAWGSTQREAGALAVSRADDVDLVSRLVAAEARGEPFDGQVAVAAVLLNRVRSPEFPNTVSGVVFQPLAFESVSNGLIWQRTPGEQVKAAVRAALNGADPSYGSLYFWNPSKPVSAWIWTRDIVTRIGRHVFAR